MHSEPNWLNIEQQLYPQVYLQKVLHIENTSIGVPIHYPVKVIYNTLHREIDVTEALAQLINAHYKSQNEYQVNMYDYEQEKFKCVGIYPFKEPILLRGLFVQSEFLIIQLKMIVEEGTPAKIKPKTDKTIKFILQKVAQWRKIHMENQKKITLEEAANMVGVSRNTLDDYYFQIKLAEKYGFNFEKELDQPFMTLRKFVKENEEKKQKTKTPTPLPHILSKYQPK